MFEYFRLTSRSRPARRSPLFQRIVSDPDGQIATTPQDFGVLSPICHPISFFGNLWRRAALNLCGIQVSRSEVKHPITRTTCVRATTSIKWTRLSCRRFRDNAVRLQLHALAYNLANFMRTLALPKGVEYWSLTTLREKVGKDRCQGGQPWPLRHVPIGQGGGAEGTVPENPEPDR